MAELFAGTTYPMDKLKENWIRFLNHSFHDDLTGTSIQEAYDKYSIPDYNDALASFSEILDNANDNIAEKLDTRVKDDTTIPVIVYNPVAANRHDIVEVTVQFPGSSPNAVRVYDKDSVEVASQIKEVSGKRAFRLQGHRG